MSNLISQLLQNYGYIAVFTLIALESLGLPLPGGTILIAAATYAATTQHLNIGVIFLVAATAAILGDNAGYWLGKVGGQRLVDRYGRYVRLDSAKLKLGRYLFERHGGNVVFFGRFVDLLRTWAAFLAGVNGMRWSRFLAFNAAGGVVWAAVFGFGAYGLGTAAAAVGQAVTIGGLTLAVLLALVAFVLMRRSMRTLQERAEAAYPGPAVAATDSRVPVAQG
jgi:membrane protein DedA with SNARE-associated domain